MTMTSVEQFSHEKCLAIEIVGEEHFIARTKSNGMFRAELERLRFIVQKATNSGSGGILEILAL